MTAARVAGGAAAGARVRLAAAGALAIVGVAVYLNSLYNGFALDDVFIIERNARVHDLRDLRSIWLTPYWPNVGEYLGLYRPLPIVLYAVQWAIGAGEAFVFHATSILMHTGVSLLVFLLLDRFATAAAAFVGALIFAVHPVHVEAVANVVGQAELIAAAAVLGACLLHAARPDPVDTSPGRSVAIALLFAAGMFAKESAVVLPALLVITDLVQRRVEPRREPLLRYARALVMPLVLMAAVLAAYLLLRYHALGGELLGVDAAPQLPYLREHRLLNAFRAFPEFMRLLFFPHDLVADYAPAVMLPAERFSGMVALGAVMLTLLVGLAALTPWHPIGHPAAWFLISVLTVSNLLFPIGVVVAERTLYLPSFAVSALIALGWDRARAWAPMIVGRRRRLVPVAIVASLIVAAGFRTWQRNPDWRDTAAVRAALLRDHPESYKAQWSHAADLAAAGDLAGALRHFELAWRIYDRDPLMALEYGTFLSRIGRVDRAAGVLESVYAAMPDVPANALGLAPVYLLQGRHEDALRLATQAFNAGHEPHTALALIAHAYTGMGRHDEAVTAWSAAIDRPDPGWSHLALHARALALAGRSDEALAAAGRARQAATGDSLAPGLLDAFTAAVRDGCYAGSPAGPATAPACDPIGPRIRP